MKEQHPPVWVTKLLRHLVSGAHGDAVTGDLIEQYRQGRRAAWFWRQAIMAILVSFVKDRTLGGFGALGWWLVLMLMVLSVAQHPSSLGGEVFAVDLALASSYVAFSIWVWRRRLPKERDGLAAGAQTGVMLGSVLVASHAIEWFGAFETTGARALCGAGSVLLMLALLGAAGSAAWQRTRSTAMALVGGLWCGSIAAAMLLSFAFGLNFVFATRAEWWLREAFVASRSQDAGAFVVRNSLESAAEIVVRISIAAILLALAGGIASSWLTKRDRRLAVYAAWFTPIVFAAGAAALGYANWLERAARPPFVMAGILMTGTALCGAHPIWSGLRKNRLKA